MNAKWPEIYNRLKFTDVSLDRVYMNEEKFFMDISWEAERIGFGHLTFCYHKDTDHWSIDNEEMPAEFCASVLFELLKKKID